MSTKDKTCLYNTIYYESNTESLRGKRAVADIVLNRAKQQKKSVCAIVKAKGQFSYYGKKKWKKLDEQYLVDVLSTNRVLDSNYTHFYHKSIRPNWSRKMQCKRIDSHLFCKSRKEK